MSNKYQKTEVLRPEDRPGQQTPNPSNSAPPPPISPQAPLPPPIQPLAGGIQKTVALTEPADATVTSKYIGFLVFMNKDETYGGRVMHLGERTVIGRDPQCDILVDDPSMSAQHMVIRLDKEDDEAEDAPLSFYLQDLATTNGTLHNGKKIIRQVLTDGDRIEIGDSLFIFKQI